MFKNKKTRNILILSVLVLVTSLFVGGTIARYVTSTSSEDEARVAIWGINDGGTTMDLFNATYELPDGTVIAQSNDGDKIIAPGTTKSSSFKILNASDIAPEVMYEVRVSIDDTNIDPLILNNPSIQWKLDNNEWGTWEDLKISLLNLTGYSSGYAVYAPGTIPPEFTNGAEHTISWQWLIDNNNDETDTELGNAAASRDISAKIVVNITAQQTDINLTDILNGNNSTYNTNDPNLLSFRADADYETFSNVKIDGEIISSDNYTTEEGSIVVNLNEDYLNTLSEGKHTMTIVTTQREILSEFEVSNSLSVSHNTTIPKGGIYYTGVTGTASGDYTGGTAYTEGDNFPTLPQTGDVYIYKDYEYRYNLNFNGTKWLKGVKQNGWGARVLDTTKSEYSLLLTAIANKSITSLRHTFADCSNLTKSQDIPITVYSLSETFLNCTSLETAPIIPNSIRNMDRTFLGCTSLKNVSTIPDSVKNMEETFADCKALVVAPHLSNTVESLSYTFAGCSSLKEIPMLPNKIIYMQGTFYDCTSLEVAPTLPKAIDMSELFYGCTSLTTPPIIPSSVTLMPSMFEGCTNLSGSIEINTYGGVETNYLPTQYTNALKGTQITEITGKCSEKMKEKLLATK